MKLFLFSGSGRGAGKSSASRKLADITISIADSMRKELSDLYPNYEWFNKRQDYKDNTRVLEYEDGTRMLRDVMVHYGQQQCKNNSTYWVDRAIQDVKSLVVCEGLDVTVAIDDLRKMCEIHAFRTNFPDLVHFHLDTPPEYAIVELEFENDELAKVADYRMTWSKK